MQRNFLSLDFGSGKIAAVLSVYDDETANLRVRRTVCEPCPAVSGSFVLDIEEVSRALDAIFAEISDYVTSSPSVVVGLRGNFLSFKRASGFQTIEGRNRVITAKDIREAINNSVPRNLSENLKVVDILPQVFTIDGKTGVQNPRGMEGFGLEVETFITCALVTHLNNLNKTLAASDCNDYLLSPSILALSETLLKNEDKQNSLLLLDIGGQNTSAIMYHKGTVSDAWEIPAGADRIVQEIADVLQNDLDSAREVLFNYEEGEDEVVDDVIFEASAGLLRALKKEFLQSMPYVKHPPTQLVITGAGAQGDIFKDAAKEVLGARKIRYEMHDELIADSEEMLDPVFTSALSLTLYGLTQQLEVAPPVKKKEGNGFLSRMMEKLGFNELMS